MEIKTTWNSDFEFDLQRFAAPAVAGNTITFTSGAQAMTAIAGAYGGADWGSTPTAGTPTSYTLNITDEASFADATLNFSAVTDAPIRITVASGKKLEDDIIITVPGGGASFHITADKTSGGADELEYVLNTDGSVTASATGTGVTVTAGTLVMAANSVAAGLAATLVRSGNITYKSGLALAGTVVTFGTNSVALTETAANNSSDTTVFANGNVSGLNTGSAVYTAATLVASSPTVTTAGTGAFTIGDDTTGTTQYTVTGDSSVTFTAAAGGASKITDVEQGTRIAFTFNANNRTLQIGENSWVRSTANGRVAIVTGSNSVSNVLDLAGGLTFTYGGNADATRTGTYTFNGKTLNVSGDNDGVTVTTSTSSITSITDVEAGAIIETSATNVNVENTGAGVTALTLGESITVNGKKFVQGSIGTVVNGAGEALKVNINSSGVVGLTEGTIYLDGTDSSSLNVTYRYAGPTIGTATITPVNGDIAIRSSNAANAAGLVIDDLDNGDSFTIKVGSLTKTYEVINGVLWNTTDSTQVSTVAVLTSNAAGVSALNATFGASATLVTANVALSAATDYNSPGTAFDAVDYTTATAPTANLTTLYGLTPVALNNFANGAYVHSSGVINTKTSSDVIATLGYDSTSGVASYTASSDSRAQTISLAGNTDAWSVTGSAAGDVITGNGRGSSLDGGAGNDQISASSDDIAYGGAGNDTLTATAARASLVGAEGADSLIAAGFDATLTGGAGADIFDISAANGGIVTDYNFSEDVFRTTTAALTGVTRNSISNDGKTLTAGFAVTLDGVSGDNYKVVLQDANKASQIVGWTGAEGTSVDFSDQTKGTVIIGDYHNAGDSLYGGSGNDIIYAGNSDSVYGAAGSNTISLAGASTSARTVGFGVASGTERDTVQNFVKGFDTETSDKIYLVTGADNLTANLTGAGVSLKSGSSTMLLSGVTKGTTGAAEVLFGDAKAAFVASNETVTVTGSDYADYIWGTKNGSVGSGVSFANVDGSVSIDLNDTTKYRNITSVIGGTGNNTLIGGSGKETLVSSGGNTSLYGGAGQDVLVGATAVKDTFFMMEGAGSDTVSGFQGYTESTAETADVLNLSGVSSAKLVSGGVQINVDDNDKVLLQGTNANTAVQFTTDGNSIAVAKIGSVSGANNFTFDNKVNYYLGGTANDTLTFSSTDTDNHSVWLDGSQGTSYASINYINGTNAGGNLVLAGDSEKQTIVGGKGDSSLWGGTGSVADSLKGGAGTNAFFYGLGEGNDTIVSSNADDTINLYNISLSDIKSGEITANSVVVEMNDGSKLTVSGSRNNKFTLASGESYTANHSTKGWDQA